MRKVLIMTMVTMDGVAQLPHAPGEDPNDFPFGEWAAPYRSEEGAATLTAEMTEPFDLLLGRNTYNIFAGYWPKQSGPVGDPFNKAKKYVVSDRQIETPWKESVLISGDVEAGLQKLKEGDGPPLQVHGSIKLAQILLRHDLADEIHLRIYPQTLGSGTRLFGEGTIPASFELLSTTATKNGVIFANYRRSGDLKTA